MTDSFHPDPVHRPSDLALTPEPETMDAPAPTPETHTAIPTVTTSNGLADPPQPVVKAEVSLQPEAEDWPAGAAPHGDLEPISPRTPSHPPSPTAAVTSVRRGDAQTEFAADVRQGDYVGAFATVVSRLCQLEIITIVEDEDNPASVQELGQNQGLAGHRLVTRIDLLTGDITNILGKRFIENPDYATVKDLHQQQIDKGLTIMRDNLQTLMSAIHGLKELAQKS